MRTGLFRGVGKKKTVEEYIALAVGYHRCSERVHNTALKMHYYLAKNTAPLGLAPSMRGMALVNLAAMENGYRIPVKRWDGLAAYPRLLQRSREFKKVLEQSDDFPNLKHINL
jgi:hypothetical protein